MSQSINPPAIPEELKNKIRHFNEKFNCVWQYRDNSEMSFTYCDMFTPEANEKQRADYEAYVSNLSYTLWNKPSIACDYDFTEEEPFCSVTYEKYKDDSAPRIKVFLHYNEYIVHDGGKKECFGYTTKNYTFDGTDISWLYTEEGWLYTEDDECKK